MPTRTSTLTRDVRDAGAFCQVVPWVGFVDDAVFFTKTGSLGAVLALDGVDYECLDTLDTAQREAVTARFEASLRLWDERTHLYQYVLKRPAGLADEGTHPHPGVDAILRRRREDRRRLGAPSFTVSLYLVVVVDAERAITAWTDSARRLARAPLATMRDALSTTSTVVDLDADVAQRAAHLRHKVDAFVQQLEDTVAPRVLAQGDAFTLFRRLLNYTPEKADGVRLRPDAPLDFDAADSALECHRTHLRLDDHYVRVLTLKEPPAQTHALLFQALYEVPSPMVIVSEWQREGQGAVRREIHAKRRHFHNAKVSMTSYVMEPTSPTDVLVDDSAAAVVRDLGSALTELTLQGRYFGQYTLTVILSDTDETALERSVGACLKAFAAHDAQVTDERYNLLNAWLAVLPGNGAYNVRSMHLLNTNAADLALLFAQDSGAPSNAHLQREALAVVDTTQHTPYHLNLHVGDVGHTLVLGATGLTGLSTAETARIQTRYDRTQLQDGTLATALTAIGRLRQAETTLETTLKNLESDAYSDVSDYHTQIAVLNKINATGVTAARMAKDTNALLVSLLEGQMLDATERREASAQAIAAQAAFLIEARPLLARTTAQTTTALTTFRIP